jgi:Fe-Mn family superoxide dismutase
MDKRSFLKTTGVLAAGVVMAPALACKQVESAMVTKPAEFVLPELGFAFTALEPHIDALTMEIHHGKHHAAYVTNLNKALAQLPAGFPSKSMEEICAEVTADQSAIRNNGGGHYNHSRFWKWIAPGGATAPSGRLMEAITSQFGSFDEMKKQFSEAAKTRFGSGWAWLCVSTNGELFISSTPNQDNPLMKNLVEKVGKPILGLDVWEHAYYLHYQNKRVDYITAFWNVVNWTQVESDFNAVK